MTLQEVKTQIMNKFIEAEKGSLDDIHLFQNQKLKGKASAYLECLYLLDQIDDTK